MRIKHKSDGYTIVEVMIVLAISGLMFIVAVNFINGKQEHTAFSTGSNDFVSQLQSVVQDVTDGHYSDIPINCTSPAPGSIIVSDSLDDNPTQGTNASCVFLGKLISFNNIGSPSADQYTTYSLAASRNISGSLPQSGVAVISKLTTQGVTSQSLYVQAMHVVDGNGNPASNPQTIGFAQGFGNLALGAPGVYQSGAQSVSLIYSTDPTSIGGTNVQPARSAVICLTDGTRYADILIGGSDADGQSSSSNNNNQLSITARQLETTPCS